MIISLDNSFRYDVHEYFGWILFSFEDYIFNITELSLLLSHNSGIEHISTWHVACILFFPMWQQCLYISIKLVGLLFDTRWRVDATFQYFITKYGWHDIVHIVIRKKHCSETWFIMVNAWYSHLLLYVVFILLTVASTVKQQKNKQL